jgi:excisionase family DNA binding protein
VSTKVTVSVPEAARLLGVSDSTLRDAIARGVVPAVRIGRRNLRIHTEVLERFARGELLDRSPANRRIP